MSFSSLGFATPLLELLESMGLREATPIQARAIPAVFEGKA